MTTSGSSGRDETGQGDVVDLLDRTPAPPMTLDTDAVLAGGRRRVRRRRTMMAGGALAVVMAAVPLAVGWDALAGRDRSEPVPAAPSRPGTTFFAQDGQEGNLGPGLVRPPQAIDASDVGEPQQPTTYRISKAGDELNLARAGASTVSPTSLPIAGRGAGGLAYAHNDRHSVVVARVPADTVSVFLVAGAGERGRGGQQSVGTVLADGTPVAVVETSQRLTTAPAAVIWRTASGRVGATNGQRPAVVDHGDHRFAYFPTMSVLGFFSPQDQAWTQGRAIGVAATTPGGPTYEVTAALFPRGVTSVKVTPNVPTARIATMQVPGTNLDLVSVLWNGPPAESDQHQWSITTNKGRYPATGEQ